MKLYLVRHGQSMGNLTGDFSTDAHDQLSELGHRQAQALAIHLQGMEWNAIYCSPLRRALQTIYPYAKMSGRQIEIWPDLAESCWQEDKDIKEEDSLRYIPAQLPPALDKKYFHFKDNHPVQPHYEESYSQGIHRLKQFLRDLKSRHEGKDDRILLISHGYTMSRLVEMILGFHPDGRIDHANTAMTCLREQEEGFQLCFSNRLLHTEY